MKQTLLRILLIILGLYLVVSLARGVWDSYQSSSRLEESENRLREVKAENKRLEEELAFRQSDYFVEKEAREKLNLGRPEETVVVMPKITVKDKEISPEVVEMPNWKKWFDLFLSSFD
jgi:cell division protein FtsB